MVSSISYLEMVAVSALFELATGIRIFINNHPSSPDEPEVEVSADMPEIKATTSSHKSPEASTSHRVLTVSCDVIVHNSTRESPSPTTPEQQNIENSSRKLELNEEQLKQQKDEENIDDKLQNDDEKEHELEMMQARVNTLTKEIRELEAKLKKHEDLENRGTSNGHSHVKRKGTERLNLNDGPVVKRCNQSPGGSRYHYWKSTKTYPEEDGMAKIGDGHARVPVKVLKQLEGTYYTNAVRKLLTQVFPRSTLATHTLSGRPSPAFPGRPAKKMLDQDLVNDIIQTVCDNCNVEENLVRISITTKCADESKMLRTRENNKSQQQDNLGKEL